MSDFSEEKISFSPTLVKEKIIPHYLKKYFRRDFFLTDFCRCSLLCPQKIERQQKTPVIDRWYKKQDKKRQNKKLGISFH